mgnify:CR=1 FL=1
MKMNNRDARSRVFESEKKKWEFRYNNQDKRIKDLDDIVTELRKTIRGLRRELKDERSV